MDFVKYHVSVSATVDIDGESVEFEYIEGTDFEHGEINIFNKNRANVTFAHIYEFAKSASVEIDNECIINIIK